MRFHETELSDAWLVEPDPIEDERGFFARTFCAREFENHGLASRFVQHSLSRSHAQGTVRGLHYQRPPHQEVKVVACLRGAIWDVMVDLRADSPTFGRWQGFELSEANRLQVYIPKGFAHGLQTLTEGAEVRYLISDYHTPHAADGIRPDDPVLRITWPLPVSAISERDRNWPTFAEVAR